MRSKFTQGPWSVGINMDTRLETDVVARGGEDYIADFGMLNGLSGGECIQNAQLASASPQMYNALNEIARFIRNNRDALEAQYIQISHLETIINRAIRAAEGESDE